MEGGNYLSEQVRALISFSHSQTIEGTDQLMSGYTAQGHPPPPRPLQCVISFCSGLTALDFNDCLSASTTSYIRSSRFKGTFTVSFVHFLELR